MQADDDGDSRMSSAASSPTNPTTATSMATSNSNGKRPITTISNGDVGQQNTIYSAQGTTSLSMTAEAEAEEIANMANGAASNKVVAGRTTGAEYAPQKHEPSGYTWTRDEDMPGWAWRNTKAMDEAARAAEGVVHKEHMILNKYGDPFELAEKETALAESLKTK